MPTRINDSDNTATWRDLADQLTDDQVAELEACEKLTYPPDASAPDQLLAGAQLRVRENEIQTLCADIPAPPDCTAEPSRWLEWDTGIYTRTYTRSRRQSCDGFTVEILSSQFSDGRPVDRAIWFNCEPLDSAGHMRDDLEADQARVFASLLVEAADELDRLGNPYPVDSTNYRCCHAIGRHAPDCEPPFV